MSNSVHATGADWVRCHTGPPECVTASGDKIDHDEDDGTPDVDVSSSGKTAAGVTIEKLVASTYEGGDCADPALTYTKVAPVHGPGDEVCWQLSVFFPTKVHTKSQHVFDFLPDTVTFISASTASTVGPVMQTSTVNPLEWTIGTGSDDIVDLGPGLVKIFVKTTAGSSLGHHSGDVEGNLMKFSYANSAGQAVALRDHADFVFKIPELAVRKGVRRINRAGEPFRPDHDHVQVDGGDLVEYGVEVKNVGTADASSSRTWDVLPANVTCADVLAISDGGICDPSTNTIKWALIPVAAGATVTLTYTMKVPPGVSPCTTYVNTAGVVEATYITNAGEPFQLIPDNSVVRDPALPAANLPAAQDVSDVYTPCATVAKERTTTVDEAGNAGLSEAAIGETIRYTVTTTIPHGTTMYGSPTIVDHLGARQQYVDGTLTATLNNAPLPGTITAVPVTTTGVTVITTTFPATWANPTGDDVLVLKFDAKVRDVDDNVRGADLPNTATLTYRDETDQLHTAGSTVGTTIVEPNVAVAKSHAPAGRVTPGQTVQFTVTASNQTGPDVSTAHGVEIVDTLPPGTDPVDANGDPVPNGGIVPPNGGIWNAGSRTITWNATARSRRTRRRTSPTRSRSSRRRSPGRPTRTTSGRRPRAWIARSRASAPPDRPRRPRPTTRPRPRTRSPSCCRR